MATTNFTTKPMVLVMIKDTFLDFIFSARSSLATDGFKTNRNSKPKRASSEENKECEQATETTDHDADVAREYADYPSV
jgi:hypothetical protein